MNGPESIRENETPPEPALVATADAPHSWDPAGRNVPAAKLDWTECLPFRQVRGLEVALEPVPTPLGNGSGDTPE